MLAEATGCKLWVFGCSELSTSILSILRHDAWGLPYPRVAIDKLRLRTHKEFHRFEFLTRGFGEGGS